MIRMTLTVLMNKHLVDAKIFGKKTKAVLHADRNGFAYALDRESGKFL